jgi:hypothetical protein
MALNLAVKYMIGTLGKVQARQTHDSFDDPEIRFCPQLLLCPYKTEVPPLLKFDTVIKINSGFRVGQNTP